MNIDSLSVVVRPRRIWEAGDLGIAMVRRWFSGIYIPWLILLLSVWLLLTILLPRNPTLVILIIWWIKPILGRTILYVLSRRMFGVNTTTLGTLKHTPKLMLLPMAGRLTLFRLSPMRVIIEAVNMLEGLKGELRRRRGAVLTSHLAANPYGIALAFCIFEWIVIFSGLYQASMILIPEEFHYQMPDHFLDDSNHWLFSIFYVATVAFLEPFYVATCFALYLNIRTLIEGWDLELQFRKWVQRCKALQAGVSVLLLGLWLGFYPSPAMAQEDAELKPVEEAAEEAPNASQRSPHADAHASAALLDEIIQDEVYLVPEETKVGWHPRDYENNEGSQTNHSGLLSALGSVLGYVFIIVVIVILAFFLVYLTRHMFIGSRGKASKDRSIEARKPEEAYHALIDPASLPDDIAAAATSAWQKGDHRLALSYLFRGALLALSKSDRLDIPSTATEEECLHLVGQAFKGSLLAFFKKLTRTWQRLAYAHEPIGESEFWGLLREWQAYCGPEGEAL